MYSVDQVLFLIFLAFCGGVTLALLVCDQDCKICNALREDLEQLGRDED